MSALGDYEITGSAAPSRVRAGALIDLLAAAVVAMLLYPQPAVRAAITGAGLPIWVFLLTLLAAVFAVFALLLIACVLTWGRTPGMYLMDVGLDPVGRPPFAKALMWAIGWLLAVMPALLGVAAVFDGETGLPARLSGLRSRGSGKA